MNVLPYRPHPLLKNGHLQTLIVGLKLGEMPAYNAVQKIVETTNGESLVVHEEQGGPLPKDAPLCVLIHGLGGDHRSGYLQRLAPRLRNSGCEVWRIDLRGCGAGNELACKPANAGLSEDIASVVAKAQMDYPDKKIRIVGFSLGGNIVLKFLGELALGENHVEIDPSRIEKCLAIAPPVDLHACADNMDRLSRRIYTKFYLKVLANLVQAKKNKWPRWNRIPDAPIKTIRQFDARYTAPLGGFANTDEYYSRSSSAPLLRHIAVPTTILADKHDPIVPFGCFEKPPLSESIDLKTTRHGGHMGYFGIDEDGNDMRWMEHFVMEHCRAD